MRIEIYQARLISMFSTNTDCDTRAYRSSESAKHSARHIRKVTTWIIGLWQPSQAFIATLLFGPSMPALPIIEPQKPQRAALIVRQ